MFCLLRPYSRVSRIVSLSKSSCATSSLINLKKAAWLSNNNQQYAKFGSTTEVKFNPVTSGIGSNLFQDMPKLECYTGAMLLGAVGDALGFRHGLWEKNRSGEDIHEQFWKLTKGKGMPALELEGPEWTTSDDTVMSLATAEALAAEGGAGFEPLCKEIASNYYSVCEYDSAGRNFGSTTLAAAQILGQDGSNWNQVPFNAQGGGCAGATRSVPIGLAFWRPSHINALIGVSVDAARMTHNNPTGYLGAVTSALFASFAIQEIPCVKWGKMLMSTLPHIADYIRYSGRAVESNLGGFQFFQQQWQKYLEERGIADGNGPAKFPLEYGVAERDKYYSSISFLGVGGASGHDSVIIAYDALLRYNQNTSEDWQNLCLAATLHGGHNSGTGSIACSLWGAMNGLHNVPSCNYQHIEKHHRILESSQQIFQKFHLNEPQWPMSFNF